MGLNGQKHISIKRVIGTQEESQNTAIPYLFKNSVKAFALRDGLAYRFFTFNFQLPVILTKEESRNTANPYLLKITKKDCLTGCIGVQVLYLQFPAASHSDEGRISEYSKPLFIKNNKEVLPHGMHWRTGPLPSVKNDRVVEWKTVQIPH